MVVLSVIDIVLLIAGLAVYLWIVGSQLGSIATNLEECADTVTQINRNAAVIEPGVGHINETGAVIAGALPLLYTMAEGIVAGAAPIPAQRPVRPPARPFSGHRRSRLHDAVGYGPAEQTDQPGPLPH